MDLRLLIAAGTAWVAVLVMLPRTPLQSAAVAGALGGCALAVVLGDLRRASEEGLALQPTRGGRRRAQERVQRRQRVLLGVGLSCALSCLTVTATATHLAIRQAGTVPALAKQRAIVTVEAVVISDPRVVASRQQRADQLVMARLSIRDVVGRAEHSRPRTPVLLFGDSQWLQVHWHQRVWLTGRLAPAEPGDDVEALLTPRSPPVIRGSPGPLTRAVEVLRRDLRQATARLPTDPAGLVPALVIGDTGRLTSELDDDMRATGMTHLNAVSGSNVTVVLMSLMWVCGWLRIPRRWRLPVCLVGLALFVMLCRPEPSVVRATAMGVVGLLATSMARPKAAAPALGCAIAVLLCLDPWLAASYGFALSVLATLGLLLFARPWGGWVARFLPERLSGLGEAIAIPVAAQAVCAPVIVLLQGSVSVVAVPANLVAAPLVAPATIAGVVTVVVAPLSSHLALLPAWLAGVPAWGIALDAHAFAGLPFGLLPWPDGPPGAVLLAALTLVALSCGPWLAIRAGHHPGVAAAALLLVAACLVPTPRFGWPPPGWVYVACDVGQGDGGVLSTGLHRGVLIDVGPDPEHIDACLHRLGVTSLDAVLLTHFHADHVGGLDGALRGRRATEIITTPVHTSPGSGREEVATQEPLVTTVAARYGVPVRSVLAGDVLEWPGITGRVRWPAREIHAGSVQNNASVVLDLQIAGVRLLFLGDAEREAQALVRRSLLSDPGTLPITLVKVAHHGSANQDPALMQLVHAPIAVISVGADNDYGHPAPRTLSLLADSASTVYRTDRGGDVAMVIQDGRTAVARP